MCLEFHVDQAQSQADARVSGCLNYIAVASEFSSFEVELPSNHRRPVLQERRWDTMWWHTPHRLLLLRHIVVVHWHMEQDLILSLVHFLLLLLPSPILQLSTGSLR